MAEDSITALVLGPAVAEWTTLRRRKGVVEKAGHQKQALAAAEGAERAAELKRALAGLKGRVAVALPSDQVLMRVVRLPSTDLDELREMAALQVDKFSPFPVEQMAVGQELLAQHEGSAQLLIAASRRENVERLEAELSASGLAPREVDVAVLGWWRLLKQENHVPAEGRHLLMIVEERSTELLVVQEGAPVVIRSLAPVNDATPHEAAEELAEELNYTLTTLESEWGLRVPGLLRLWHRSGVPLAFFEHLRTRCEAQVEAHPLDALPPLSEGLARRALERGPHLLDLAPPEWKAAVASRRLTRRLMTAGAVFLGLWLLALAILLIGLQLNKGRLAAARAELAALQGPAREVEQFKNQVRALERYLDPTFSALECLREICDRLPDGVDINAFTYKKYAQIALRGESDSSEPIYDFFQALEKTELFPEVKPEGVTQQTRAGRTRSQFKLAINLPAEDAP